jgi:deoxyribodipyrimidine photo-lyase
VKRAIHWFRRDLRVADNTSLSEAVQRAEEVVPVFIIEEALRTGPDVGAARLAFLFKSLEVLRENLATLGYPLVVRRGRSIDLLPKLCQELGVEAVFANRRYEPYAQARDNRLFNELNALGVGFEVFKDAVAWEEREILTRTGNPFTVFTPYAKVWRTKTPAPPRPGIPKVRRAIQEFRSDSRPLDPGEFGYSPKQSIPPAGEAAALAILKSFLAGPVFSYATQRDIPAESGTSKLSPHLRCGTIGIRTIYAALREAQAGSRPEQQRNCDVWLNELIWREFYLQILDNFPHVMKGAFRPEYDNLEWGGSDEWFQAWCSGMTGYPIVDAAMRCLNSTGWMHNRLRMIVAMFLTKDLLISWRRGERYFMQQLVDGDMAANNGGWQWSAGTGTDAAPYFRIFNPMSQGEKFDPSGAFVRRWVPELESLPDVTIHQPWNASPGTVPGNYPKRAVIHEEQRPKCLAMFKAVKPPSVAR